MNPIKKTLLMGVLAAIFCGAAAYYYPRTAAEAVTGETGQKLFEEFENQVWTIQIAKFNRENENLKSLSLRRKGQKWLIGKSKMVLTGALITVAAGSLNEKTILQEESDDEQDHAKFGVVDPLQFQAVKNRGSLGTKITLEDVNRNTLGSLIVGHRVKNTQSQYYVRKPGQPKVYTVEFDPRVLTTAIGDWMDPNIAGLQTQRNPDGLVAQLVSIDNYRMDTTGPEKGNVDYFYEATWQITPNGIRLKELKTPSEDGGTVVQPSKEQQQKLSNTLRLLGSIRMIDAQTKSPALADAISTAGVELTAKQFAPAAEKGFALVEVDGQPKFRGSNGSVTVVSKQGVEVTLLFGGITTTSEAPADSLNYQMIVIAKVTPELRKKPAAPKPKTEGGELTDEQKKEFARATKQWKSKLESATQRVTDFNRQHADWYYVVSDELVSGLRPDLNLDSKSKETPEVPNEDPAS